MIFAKRHLLVLLSLGTVIGCGAAYAQTQPANYLLYDLSSQLGGESTFIKWTNLTAQNPSRVKHSSSTAEGSIGVIGGFQASAGLYSYRNDFGTVSTAQSDTFAIKTAVLQVAMMPNPGEGNYNWTLEDHFNYNHSAHFQPGDEFGGSGDPNDPDGVTSYGYVEELGAMKDKVDNYTGGPLLKWTDTNGNSGYLQATVYGNLGDPMYLELVGWQGYYYNFAWQWDLSTIPTDIVQVEVTNPTIVHSSTLGVQLTIGDTYAIVVPEPAFYAVLLGVASMAFIYRRRKMALKA